MNPNGKIFLKRFGARAFFLWVVVLLAFVMSGGGRLLARAETNALPFLVRQWTIENGLPQDRINCLKQTRDGYLWIGTWMGLVRFDGLKFTVFRREGTEEGLPGMKDDCINALLEDTDGTLWIATKRGIILYRDGKFQNLKGPAELIEEKVWSLSHAKAEGIWFCTDDLLVYCRDGKFVTIALPKNSGSKLTLTESSDGRLNVFYKQTWFTIAPDKMELETKHVGETNEGPYRSALCDGGDRFWLGTADGLKLFDGSRPQTRASQTLATNAINFLFRAADGKMWVDAERAGLWQKEGTNFSKVNLVKTRTPPAVICMTEDYEGGVWAGTDVGLFQLRRPSVRVFTSYDGLPSDNVMAVCEDRKGTIWAASNYAVTAIRDEMVESLRGDEPSFSKHSRSVWPKGDGGIWLGTKNGEVLDNSNGFFSVVLTNAFAVHATLTTVYEDRSGRLWVGTRIGAVAFEADRFDRPVISTMEHDVKDVCAILEDRTGAIWFGTKREGLARLRNGKYSRFTKLDGLSDDQVWNVSEDSTGALWFGTGNGLTRYHNGKFFAFRVSHGLREEPVNCVLEDDFGYIWIGGLKGIYRVKREDLEAVASGRKPTFQSITIGTADGMESAETNGERQPAGWKARDGRLWFPTTRGLAVIDPKRVGQRNDGPLVVVEGVKADGRVIFNNGIFSDGRETAESSSPAKISAGHGHVIEFTYTANTFSNPEKTAFRYRLAGVDAVWHDPTRERTIRYLNLRPGPYRFEVAALSRHGQWNEKPAIFPFTLEPQFWQTWPFYAACVAGFFGMVGGIHWYRLRWQRRLLKLDEQRALANERARIARDLHDDLGSALTGLALELDVAGAGGKRGQPSADRVTAAAQGARGLAQRMREVVWAINPRCDNTASLSDFLEEQITQFLSNAGIQVRLDFPEDIPIVPIDAETRHQLSLCVREALNNIVRHARATQVSVQLRFSNDVVCLLISDNGCGFDSTQRCGNGLTNIRDRFAKIDGTFECISVPGNGSELRFTVPVSKTLDHSE